MGSSVRWRAASALCIALGALGSVIAVPARAECLWLDAEVTWTNGTKTRTPWPAEHCHVPTPWPELVHPYVYDDGGLGPVRDVRVEGSVPTP